jgi:prophage regulatory protein
MNHPDEPHVTAASKSPGHPSDPIIRKMHCASIVGLSKTRIEALVREGKFPPPFKLCPGGRASGWLRSTLEQWNAARANAAATARQCPKAKATQ